MAVKASVTITISKYRDTDSITRYYKLQASTATAPAKPTTLTPSGWTDTEPTYTSGSTNTLYIVDRYIFSDGTFQYTEVSKSTSYEAAKEAYNKAQAAQDSANDVANKLLERDIIVGTQTASTRFWTGISKLESLKDGDEILYWLPYATVKGAASDDKTVGVEMRIDASTVKTVGTKISTFENADQTKVWLNLTLKDGTTKTGWIPCYYGGTTRLTTHYGAGNCIRLIYRVNANISGVQYTGWFGDANYYSDSNTYDRIKLNNIIKAKTAIAASTLIVGDSNGFFKLVAGVSFDIDKPILWASSAIAAAATGTNNYLSMPNCTLRNNTNSSWTATQYKTLYLVGKLNGNTFTVDSTTPFTTTIPTSDDGKYYISLGYMYSTYQMYLYPEHPIFKYVNGQFKNISQIAYEAQDNLDNFEVKVVARNYISNDFDNWVKGNWSIPSVGEKTSIVDYNNRISLKEKIEIEPNTDYWVKVYSSKENINVLFRICDEDDNFIRSVTALQDQKWTSLSTDKYIHVTVYENSEHDDIKNGITKIKIEKGNKPTDWSSSPEDEEKKTRDTVENIREGLQTQISTARSDIDSLNATIENLVVDKDGRTLMEQTSTGWRFNMSSIQETLSGLAEELATKGPDNTKDISDLQGLLAALQNQVAYVECTSVNNIPKVTLGSTDSPFKVVITNTEISFMNGSSTPAYVNGDVFYGNNITAKKQLQVGENPGFVWKVRESGNMGLTYVP
jgi:hypothetical protein